MLMVLKAIKFADKCHRGQKRKGNGLPYVTHPVAVSYLLAKYKVSKHLEELIVAAILHDVMEDCGVSFLTLARMFSPLVASLVQELTNDQKEIDRIGKLAYQTNKMVGMSSWGLVIKLVDRLHNISDKPTGKMVGDTLTLMARLRDRRKLSKTQLRIVADIEAACVSASEVMGAAA